MTSRVAVIRDALFSPNSERNDKAILQEVAERMGIDVLVSEKELIFEKTRQEIASSMLFLSMGRMPETLQWLAQREKEGAVVLNSPMGVARCVRNVWHTVMREHHWPIPPERGDEGHWVKRGDMAAQHADDVVFVPKNESVDEWVSRFHNRGVKEVSVMAHVPGDVVKFYGVLDTGFFRYFYPTDDGITKFEHEKVNGPANHFRFNVDGLKTVAEQLARTLDVKIYGGDCIVDEKGRFFLIDFNDWPSFSRCRTDAAEAIVRLATMCLQKRQNQV